MAEHDAFDYARKIFLAGVGAVATAGDKGSEMLDEFIRKGEETVRQGQALNEELKHRAKTAKDEATDAALMARLASMTEEERDAFVRKVNDMAEDVKRAKVKVEVDVDGDEADIEEDA